MIGPKRGNSPFQQWPIAGSHPPEEVLPCRVEDSAVPWPREIRVTQPESGTPPPTSDDTESRSDPRPEPYHPMTSSR